jgi:hypothetical protein
MKIALIQNNEVVQTGEYWELFPNTSFNLNGPDDAWLVENSCKKVNIFKDYDQLTQKLVSSAPYVEGDWVYMVSVVALSDEEIASAKASALSQIRTNRDRLLSACDWTQLPDVNFAKKSEWTTYRQTLRDLPNTITTDPRTWNSWPHDPDYVVRTENQT